MEVTAADLMALLDSGQLQELEDQLSSFNIFEAVGVRAHEIRHSNFLAFLLNPRERHGLGDQFARGLFSAVDENARTKRLRDGRVYRELHHIDILFVSDEAKYVVLIENKVWSHEHGEQLSQYLSVVKQRYEDLAYETLYLLLSPSGVPAKSQAVYKPLRYKTVVNVLERIVVGATQETQLVIRHYCALLRRYKMDDEASSLAKRIYSQFTNAIEFIYKQESGKELPILRQLLSGLLYNADLVPVDANR